MNPQSEKSPTPWPTSPRALLEARYQAFIDADVDFILDSCHPETRSQHKRDEVEAWAKNSHWLGLEVESEEPVGGEVSNLVFCVRYQEKNQDKVTEHRELAQFRKHEGRWFYYDSTFPKPKTFRHAEARVDRNDPCPCGSGKKYKKCCGA